MKRFFLNWWLLTGLAAILVAVLLVFILPLVAPFLRPWWVKTLFAMLVAVVWGVFATLRILKARRAAAEIAKQLAAVSPGDVEAEALAGRMRSALAKLKTATGDKRDYLYARPWYVIIGPPAPARRPPC